jgi:hypothetical protein
MSRRAAVHFLPALVLLFGPFAGPVSAQQLGGDEAPIATEVPDRVATKVFVLGTPRLSGVAERFDPSMADPLM